MEKRALGQTGWQSSVLGLGGGDGTFTAASFQESVAVVHRLLDGGVNYLDTAAGYEDSEDRIGEVMKTRRSEVFLSTKTRHRTRQGALEDLKRSLERLQTGVIDQVNLHNVRTLAELDLALASDGAVPALEEAQRAGVIRFIGITGHYDPHVVATALERYPFATVLVPVNLLDRDFVDIVGPVASRLGVGINAMKPYGGGMLAAYRRVALRYVLSMPGVVTACVGTTVLKHAEENLELAQTFSPMNADEQAEATRAALEACKKGWWRAGTGMAPWRTQPATTTA